MNAVSGHLVSVIIPTYNHAHFLGRALQSVLDQTYTNWEAIIVDNYSQDNTDEVVQSFADKRISLLKIHNNGVIASSRNMGIRAAKGEWIALLDSDDWWMSNKLEVCFKHINDQVDIVYHSLEIVRDTPSVFQRKRLKSRQVKKPVLVDLLLSGNLIANSSVVVRKKLLDQVGGINESVEMIAAEDYNTWMRIARLTDAFIHIPECLGYYLMHDGGISKKDMSFPHARAVAEFVAELSSTCREKVAANVSYMSGKYYVSRGEYDRALEKFEYCRSKAIFSIKLKVAAMLVFINIRRHMK
jgi:glycosyltransferase involved in cell wall biosynthesis